MSFPPFDSSAPTRTPPPLRPVYGQPAQYGAYDQPQYGAMGYGDIPQQQMPLRYPSTPGLAYPPQTESYMGPSPSFSPTASQFAAQPYAAEDMDAMSYQVPSIRRRYQSTGGALQGHSHSTDPRYPTPRRPSADMHMPTMHESYDVVPSQQPDSAPVARPGTTRSSSSGASSNVADSALALERPYECDICHTRFARQHDCRRHRETHAVNASGEKPHHCVVCGKSFTRKDALKRHTNQKGCDIAMGGSGYGTSRSARSSSSPQQVAGTFYPVGSLPPSGSHY